jgi:two-component system, chemotaxis family, protein-glutamate methylesterase/glutaminase
MSNIRVLVVDDSSLMRRSLSHILETAPEIKVIGTAANGQEAVELAKKLRPDVVTLDVIMPVMDGIQALRQIVKETNARVIMVSSETQEGSKQTIEALSLGAVDYVTKTSGQVSMDIGKISAELIGKVKTAYRSKTVLLDPVNAAGRKFRQIISDLSSRNSTVKHEKYAAKTEISVRKELVTIASSTGGPAALQVVLAGLPSDFPAGVVIVQHISEGFSRALANKLNEVAPLEVRLCREIDEIKPGLALLAPDGYHVTVRRMGNRALAVLSREPANTLHRPSANVLFSSVASVFGGRSCAVILTGMGDDGARGMKEIRERGGITIAQDEATSVIFGMPKAAIDIGAIQIVAPINEIASRIITSMS